jgi:trk system potassium uptake protein TrkA
VPLKALKLKDSVLVASIIRRGKCRVPSGNDAIELGDRVVVVTTNHGMHELKDILK